MGESGAGSGATVGQMGEVGILLTSLAQLCDNIFTSTPVNTLRSCHRYCETKIIGIAS